MAQNKGVSVQSRLVDLVDNICRSRYKTPLHVQDRLKDIVAEAHRNGDRTITDTAVKDAFIILLREASKAKKSVEIPSPIASYYLR